MVKLLQIPVDDIKINKINPAQIFWYSYMIKKDREESVEINREYIEYLAAFINPEAINKIQLDRENTTKVSDGDFNKGLDNLFGRTINPNARSIPVPQEAPEKRMSAKQMMRTPVIKERKKKGAVSIEDLSKYTGLELDEIKFIPKK